MLLDRRMRDSMSSELLVAALDGAWEELRSRFSNAAESSSVGRAVDKDDSAMFLSMRLFELAQRRSVAVDELVVGV